MCTSRAIHGAGRSMTRRHAPRARCAHPLWRRDLSALVACVASTIVILAGCAAEKHEAPKPYANWADPLQLLPHGSKQTARVCERNGDDLVRDVFCGATPPALTGLVDLQTALELDSRRIG